MQGTSLGTIIGRLVGTIGILAGLLLLAGTRTAAAEVEKPHTVGGYANSPGWITVTWKYDGDPYDVATFLIKRQNPDQSIVDAGWADAGRSDFTDKFLQPSTSYRYYVCAVSFANELGVVDYACADELSPTITTWPPQQPPQQPPPPPTPGALPPTPVLSATVRAPTEIYLTWPFPGYEARLTSVALYRDGTFIYEALRPGNFDSDHVDAVQPNSTHRYHLCFRNPDGERCSAPITVSTPAVPQPPSGQLTPPRNVRETQSRDGVTLTWELGTGAAFHRVECVNISDGNRCGLTYSTVDGHRGVEVASNRQQLLWETTSFTFKDLRHPKYYVVRVCSARGAGGNNPDLTACAPDMVIWPEPFGTVDYGGTPGPAPNGCKDGVWRWAFEGDRVCVAPARTIQVIADNAQAAARREPNGGAYGPNTCRPGYVWREARVEDLVCVTPEERARIAAENAAANRR